MELVGALSRDLRGEDAFLKDAAPGAIVEVFETVAPEREYTVPAAGEVFEPAPSFRPSDRGVPVRLRDNQHAWAIKYRVLAPRTPRWWRAVCDVDLDDAAARDFCAGLAGRHWVAEPGGVFTFCASRTVMSCVEMEIKQRRVDGVGAPEIRLGRLHTQATPTHYRFSAKEWRWSPDRLNWTPVTEFLSGGVRWRARTLAEGDRQICRFLARRAPAPDAWRLAPTSCSLAYDAPPQRRRDDDRGARSAHRSIRPDAHGGVLALADTRVQVIPPPSRRRGASCTRSRTSCRAILVDGCHLMIMRARRGAVGWGPPRILAATTTESALNSESRFVIAAPRPGRVGLVGRGRVGGGFPLREFVAGARPPPAPAPARRPPKSCTCPPSP